MTVTAKQIAEWVNGKIIGDSNIEINDISKIEDGKPNSISFLSNEKYSTYLFTTKANIVLISKNLVPKEKINSTLIVVEDAHQSFLTLLNFYNQFQDQKKGISKNTNIHKSVKIKSNAYIGAFTVIEENVSIGENVKIYPNCYIGKNVTLGNNVTIEPNVVIFNNCQLHNNIIIHAGTIIGSDGFGFQPTKDGYQKIPQLGNVILEDNVEIGANCSIDRATMGSTIIKKGSKLDNLIQIAHNVEIGKHNVIASQTGIAGSTKIGEWNMIGGQVGIAGHITIGNKIKIQAQSGVSKNFPEGSAIYGSPAYDAISFTKNYVHFKNLNKLVKRIEELEKNR